MGRWLCRSLPVDPLLHLPTPPPPPPPPCSHQAVASLAWSFSTLRYDHPQLYECLAHAALRLLGVQQQAAAQQGAAGARHASSGSGGGQAGSASGGSGASTTPAAFNAQTVSVIIFSFAAANRCDSPAQRQASTKGSQSYWGGVTV